MFEYIMVTPTPLLALRFVCNGKAEKAYELARTEEICDSIIGVGGRGVNTSEVFLMVVPRIKKGEK